MESWTEKNAGAIPRPEMDFHQFDAIVDRLTRDLIRRLELSNTAALIDDAESAAPPIVPPSDMYNELRDEIKSSLLQKLGL